MIEQELCNRLPGRDVATLLTQIEVDPDGSVFADPSKPIGPVYDRETAQRLADERGWFARTREPLSSVNERAAERGSESVCCVCLIPELRALIETLTLRP